VVILLALAMVCSTATVLWLSRGGTYWHDDLAWFMYTPGLSPSDALEPHYGHLVLMPRLLYKAVLETLGADYVTFRVLLAIAVTSTAGLFFVYARRRVGDLAALIPTVLLLFLGAAWVHLVIPTGVTVLSGVALGLGALIALDRGDRRGDVAACVLLCVGAATYSTAIPYLVASCVAIMIAPNRLRRSWIFLIPLGLYATWFVLARQAGAGPGDQVDFVNVLLAPEWALDSFALVLSSLSGLGYSFSGAPGGAEANIDLETGRVLAVAALVGLAWHVRQRGINAGLWVALAVPLVYWTMGAGAAGIEARVPELSRYVYPGVVGVLLVVVEVFRDRRLPLRWLGAVAAVAALALATNLILLRDGARHYRGTYSGDARAQLAAFDLARGAVSPDFDPTLFEGSTDVLGSAWSALRRAGEQPTATYLDASSRYGSPGFSVPELERQSETVRARTDVVLAAALELSLESGGPPDERRCESVSASAGGTSSSPLPAGGAYLRARDPATTAVRVRRFAALATVSVGTLSGDWVELKVPSDYSPNPWYVSVDARELELCPLD
jgi:hypothetical protein